MYKGESCSSLFGDKCNVLTGYSFRTSSNIYFDKGISPLNAIDCENLADQLPITIAGIKIQWIYIVEVLYCMLLAGGGIFFTRVLTKNQKYYAS